MNKKLAINILNIALHTGADFAEIFYDVNTAHSINIENGLVDIASSSVSTGVGIRILKNHQSIYGYTKDLSKQSLINLANDLSSSFADNHLVKVNELKSLKYKHRNKVIDSCFNHKDDEYVYLIKQGIQEIDRYKDERIVKTIGNFSYIRKNVEIYNSKGIIAKKENEYSRILFESIAKDDKGFEVGYEVDGSQQGFNYFTSEMIKHLANKSYETAIRNLNAKLCPTGMMPVVVGHGIGGVLFHEACGHSLEATSVAKNLSVFSNRKGSQIASKLVTAIDDPTIPYAWGSLDVDDEGNIAKKHTLIKNGVLTDYLVDDFNGRRMNEAGNGASRRASSSYAPTSRMSNTYIANGKSTYDEIISSVKLGLYAVGFMGGSVDPTTGEFNFGCSDAYIIRDGKICEPVRGATLIGKGEQILKDIDMVGNDLELAPGSCGSISGNIRVCVGQPTIRIKSILVGGQGGELK